MPRISALRFERERTKNVPDTEIFFSIQKTVVLCKNKHFGSNFKKNAFIPIIQSRNTCIKNGGLRSFMENT